MLEKHLLNFIEKYNLQIIDIFLGNDHLKEKIFSKISELNLNDIFNESRNKVNLIFDELKQELFRIDKPLSESVSKYRERSLQLLNELQSKAVKIQDGKFDTVIRQINKLTNMLYPNQNLQEREINFIYFYNKFGSDIFDTIFDELSIQQFEHQIIYL